MHHSGTRNEGHIPDEAREGKIKKKEGEDEEREGRREEEREGGREGWKEEERGSTNVMKIDRKEVLEEGLSYVFNYNTGLFLC